MNASPPPPAPPPAVADWRTYRRLARYLRPYAPRLAVVLAISLLSTALNLAQPYLSKLMIDDALLRGDLHMLAVISGALLGVTIVGFALNMLASYRYVALSAAMLYDIRVALLRHLQTLSPRFFAGFRLGDLMSRINSDVSDVQRVAADTLLSVLSNLLFLLGSIALMLWLNWRLFVVGTLLLPACLAAFVLCQRRLTAQTRDMRERGADLGSFLVDTVMGMRTVTALRAGEREVARFGAHNRAFVAAMLRMQLTSFATGALPGTLLTASTAAVVLYGGTMIVDGTMTIGTLVAFMTYHGRLFAPIQVLMGLGSGLASTRVSLARIFALFDTPPDVTDAPDARALPPIIRDIRFDHVARRHDRDAVLTDVDLTIPAGAFCAILGPSGVGKSTLADLLVRYHDADAGRILIDGTDIRGVPLDDLRRRIILIEQVPHVFNDTIAANIAFGLDAVDADRMAEAVHVAGLDTLAARLPQGLATRTGERGHALSAGERQRLALARAVLRRPDVLILDEPTSALDEETEALVAGRLRAAMPDVTLIVITHKPSLAARADMIVRIADGRAHVTQPDLAPAT
ncbi:ABC transporter ATP-binding protein [uncultured Sphingomonas sp.]|uniref:ABC transporter ATP-binding protein n=1 Tax=uncultured Sphingomonas sp. TaxID=158754 RepID=UPI0025893933|nr:ABC transporter ATP-binding protein [uncultured Sphingomonas sp.]